MHMIGILFNAALALTAIQLTAAQSLLKLMTEEYSGENTTSAKSKLSPPKTTSVTFASMNTAPASTVDRPKVPRGQCAPTSSKVLEHYLAKEINAKLTGMPFTVSEAEMRAHIEYMRAQGRESHFKAP
jgi:hypothetical protein